MAVDISRSTSTPASSSTSAEAPVTLDERPARTLGMLDQFGFWGNVGVSLLGFSGAIAILSPNGLPLSFGAAVLAAVVGSVFGGLILGASLVLGARTGAPAMVLLRGLLGARASFLPTVLNIAQCLGWAIFELVTIASGLTALSHGHLPRWLSILVAGTITTALTIRPLGWIRALRKYVSVLVVLALLVLAIGLLREHSGHLTGTGGSWRDFWLAVDSAMALTISWVPLGADYSRHSRTAGAAFAGGFVGYGLTQVACLVIGLVALAQVSGDGIFDLFIGLPLGAIAFAVLVIRETDQSFANVYSTAISIQNLRPSWDRRVLTLAIGVLTTALALSINIGDYANFLYLIGGVFIPMSGTLIAAWLRTRGRHWDVSADAPLRPGMLAGWLVGFVVYQLINPGTIDHWSDFWTRLGTDLHTLGHPWLSASIASFVVAVLIALPVAGDRSATLVENRS